jgi:hypothetical protein
MTLIRVCQRTVPWAALFSGVAWAIFVIWEEISWAAIEIRGAAVEVPWEGVTWAAISGAVAACIKHSMARSEVFKGYTFF